MSYGDPLVNLVPAVATVGPGYATQVNAAITEIQTVLQTKVPFTSLLGGTLSMNGSPIESISYAAFTNQSGTPSISPAGRIVYSDNNFWLVTASGAIQITSGTTLNASAVGGITGDYGGGNPATLRFTDSTQTYGFYDDFGTLTWGYTRARGYEVAAGATSLVTCSVLYEGIASNTFYLPIDKPGANRSVLQYSSTGRVTHNTSVDTLTNDLYLASGKRVREPGRQRAILCSFYKDKLVGGSWSSRESAGTIQGVTAGATPTTFEVELNLDYGETITSISARTNKTGTGASFIELRRRFEDGTFAVVATWTSANYIVAGATTMTVSGTPEIVAASYTYYVRVVMGNATDWCTHVVVTYTS